MIYFLQSTEGGPVKIGYSSNVESRIKRLESHYGRPLAVLATMPGDRDEEQEIHSRFSHLRLGRTEQFQPGPDLMEFIGKPLLVDSNPEAVEVMKPAIEVTTKPVRLDLTEEAHHLLRILSSFDGKSMSSYARDLVEDHVRSEAKRKGIKV